MISPGRLSQDETEEYTGQKNKMRLKTKGIGNIFHEIIAAKNLKIQKNKWTSKCKRYLKLQIDVTKNNLSHTQSIKQETNNI